MNDDYDIGIDLLNEADEEYDTEMSLIVDEIMGTRSMLTLFPM